MLVLLTDIPLRRTYLKFYLRYYKKKVTLALQYSYYFSFLKIENNKIYSFQKFFK